MNEKPPSETGSRPGEPMLGHLFSSAPTSDRSTSVRGAGGSLLLHGLVVALALWASRSHSLLVTADVGVGAGVSSGAAGGGGGGGQEDIAYIQLSAPPPSVTPLPELTEPPAPIPPPLPEPTPVPEVTPPLAAPDVSTPIASAGTGMGPLAAGTGPGAGPGTGPGSGSGSGGGEGSGIGTGTGPGTGKGRILAPYPEFLLIPPTAPGSVRGKTVVVRLAIDETGTVRDVELRPETGNRGYNRELRRVALGWKFKPARDSANNPVAVQFDVTFNF